MEIIERMLKKIMFVLDGEAEEKYFLCSLRFIWLLLTFNRGARV